MGTRQNTNFRHDRANGFGITAINTVACLQNRTTNNIGFHFFEETTSQNRINLFTKGFHGGGFNITNSGLTAGLISNRISLFQILAELLQRLCDGRGIFWFFWQFTRFFSSNFSQFNDRADDGLHFIMTEIHRAQHIRFRKFFGFGFNHQHAFTCTGHNQIKAAVCHFIKGWVQHISAINHPHTARANRAKERHAGKRQCR